MKYWVIFFFVLASFRSDDGEVAHIEETGHGVVMNFTGMRCVQSNAYLNSRQKRRPMGAKYSPFTKGALKPLKVNS
jgi:hypothetical protein